MYRPALVLLASPLLLFALADGKKAGPQTAGGKAVRALVTGLQNPESVCVGTDGRVYVSCIGEDGKDGDGSVVVVADGKAKPFASGLDDPKGIVAFSGNLFVADRTRVWRIDARGKATVHVDASAFPAKPLFLNDIESDGQGTLYVSDSGDTRGKLGAIYKIDPQRKVTTVATEKTHPALGSVNGLRLLDEYHLHAFNLTSGDLLRVRLSDGKTTKLAGGIVGGDGITFDHNGRVFLTTWSGGKVYGIARPGEKPVLVASGFESAADLCLAPGGKGLLVPDMKAGVLYEVPAVIPGAEVDDRSLPVKLEPAFADLEWTGWKGVSEKGVVVAQRPILLTHAGDGSGRVFVIEQRGAIHAFQPDSKGEDARKTKLFLDLRKKVRYTDIEFEEGLLGLAFHPKFKDNGEFFVYYTPKKPRLVNHLSRFRVKKGNPGEADLDAEEILLTCKRPFWNHDGGTLLFGPDGYLYVAVGDGGKANDPFRNGQNLGTLLGKVLRIDVNRKDRGLSYALPPDNPFVGKKGARGEIWCYGLRNPWRMAFDRKTGKLWLADVGQNLWEEIDRVERGGNYGWNVREGLHPFGDNGVGPRRSLIDPIWEYHHDIGKSITGGHVYRGKAVPALAGLYLYADYVSGDVWALRYDEKRKRVTGNHLLRKGGFPVYSFGEDEAGESYVLTSTPTGQGIFRFAKK